MSWKDPEKSDLKNVLIIIFFVAAILLASAYFGVRTN